MNERITSTSQGQRQGNKQVMLTFMEMSGKKRKIFTVSRLNQEVQTALESSFGMIWLQGELSNFSKPASGHFYFSLKDSQSQIRCAMFRAKNRYVDFDPQVGDEVLVRGKLGLYAARGDFQLIVEHMEPAGEGKLQLAFEATKRKLDELGWFDINAKQELPEMPNRIGVVTSATGAAIRDVLQVLKRRCPQAQIIIYPTLVQGAQAAPDIVKAIDTANRRKEVDVLLLVRGGGSMEDLWAFNDEKVAQAIYKSKLPIVSGVGHEVDITIADLVADLRAPTPSAAAELATPDAAALVQGVSDAGKALVRIIHSRLEQRQTALTSLNERLQKRHPARLLQDRVQRIDELESRLQQSATRQLNVHMLRLTSLHERLNSNTPLLKLAGMNGQLSNASTRLNSAMLRLLSNAKSRFQLSARALDTVSPLATLDRGFAVVKHKEKLITDAAQLNPGDQILTQLAHGSVSSTVDSTAQNNQLDKKTAKR